jgi:hypothetical protein
MIYKLGCISSLDAELALTYFVALTRGYPDQLTIQSLEIELTAAAAERASG